MTRLFIRFKSFYVITSFLLIVFLFYPLKTFGANITQQLATQEDGNIPTITVNATTANTKTIQSWITITGITATTPISGVSIVPTGFYKENGEWYSKVFNGTSLAQITHTINWASGPTSTSLNFKSSDNSLLRLQVTSTKVNLCNNTTYDIPPTDFFDNGNAFGFKFPNSDCNTGIISSSKTNHKYPQYQVQAVSVPLPSISTFTATPTLSGKMAEVLPSTEPKVYKLISGNSFTLNWTVANATATTQCALTENNVNPKTFEGIGAGTYNFSLNTSNVGSFKYDVSNLTANTTYNVSCSHNGLGTTLQRQINIAVVPAPSVTKFLVKNANGATLADGLIPNAEITVDDDQQK